MPQAENQESIPHMAARLNAVRKALGLSQAAISVRLELTKTQWNNWEKGRARIGLQPALRMRELFGVTLDWIYAGDARAMPYELMQEIQRHYEPPPTTH